MIGLSSPSEIISDNLLKHPGSFVWWYVDACDHNGNGFVLIWSWGLPFLPGLASGDRNGKPTPAIDRPAITLSIYEQHKQTFYLFEELKPEEARWEHRCSKEDRWTFGSNVLQYTNTEDSCVLRGTIHLDVPGQDTPLTGTFKCTGALRKELQSNTPSDPNHLWSPISVQANCQAEFKTDSYSFSVQNLRSYHDRNASNLPLHRLGIKEWSWGRTAFTSYEIIWYMLYPEEGDPIKMLLRINKDGSSSCENISKAEQEGWRQSIYGLGHPKILHLETANTQLCVQYTSLIDDGPFYQRYFVTATQNSAPSEQGYGFAELVVPDKVDPEWMLWLIRMRVKQPQDNSIWLPLFSGPSYTRIRRLVSQLWT